MHARGVITGYGPDIDPAAIGYGVMAFVTLELRQAGGHDPVARRLAAIAEVLEAHTITGSGDMLCRVVARSNADLQRVIDAIVDLDGVVRTSTVIALDSPLPYRVLPLIRVCAQPACRCGVPPAPGVTAGRVPSGGRARRGRVGQLERHVEQPQPPARPGWPPCPGSACSRS